MVWESNIDHRDRGVGGLPDKANSGGEKCDFGSIADEVASQENSITSSSSPAAARHLDIPFPPSSDDASPTAQGTHVHARAAGSHLESNNSTENLAASGAPSLQIRDTQWHVPQYQVGTSWKKSVVVEVDGPHSWSRDETHSPSATTLWRQRLLLR